MYTGLLHSADNSFNVSLASERKAKAKSIFMKTLTFTYAIARFSYVCLCVVCGVLSPNTVRMESIYFMVSFKSCFTIKPSDTCCAVLFPLPPPTQRHHLFHFYLLFVCVHWLYAHECASFRLLCVICLFP